MADIPNPNPVPDLERLAIEALAKSVDPAELEAVARDPDALTARALSRLDVEQRVAILTSVSPETAAEIVDRLPDSQAVDVIEELTPHAAAVILQELPSDALADLLGELDDADADAILESMSAEDAEEARRLVEYDDEVAGGLMVTEYLAFPATKTTAEVVADLRENAEKYRDYVVQYAYVVRESGELEGVLRLRDLLLARPRTSLADLAIRTVDTVFDSTPLDELRAFFATHRYFGVPVVDHLGRLVGVVERSAVEAALGDRAESDLLKLQGIVGGEEIRTMPLARRVSRRLAWLSSNVVLNLIAASVIAAYQDTLAAVISLAVFLPIISDMSGCSGNQAVAVTMRELALGLARPGDAFAVWWKEAQVGLINGVILGLLLASLAWIWKGNPWLGLVVGSALSINTMFAVSVGGVIPLVLRRLGVDPALASGPVLTTLTDMCGFFLVFAFASAALAHLVG